MADVTSAEPGFAGRKRVRDHSTSGAGYRTFAARVPATLTAIGGGFVALGALGAGVRASAVSDVREDPRQVRVLLGYRQGLGWVLAVLGLLLVFAALAWLSRRESWRLAAGGLALATGVLIVGRLRSFDERAGDWVDAARRAPRYLGFHAGFGWGAWCLMVGAILLAFGLLVGVLREVDRRQGIEG